MLSYVHREEVLRAFDEIFSIWQPPYPELREIIAASVLTKGAIIMLTGVPGTGKSTLVRIIMKTLFSDVYRQDPRPIASFRQGRTEYDVFFYIDTGALARGEEKVSPRPIITSPFKYINEIQRGNDRLYSALLSLFQEGYLDVRGKVFRTPPYVAFLDRNPRDRGAVELPRALWDRVTVEVVVPSLGILREYDLALEQEGSGMEDLVSLAEERMTSREMAEVWDDVMKVPVDPSALLMLSLLKGSFRCQKGRDDDVLMMRPDCSNCQYNGELCSKVEYAPGSRWRENTQRVAKALAWLRGDEVAGVEHFLEVLPYTLGHALRLSSSYRAYSGQKFVREEVIKNVLAVKAVPGGVWIKAIDAYVSNNIPKLEDLADRDPAVKEMLREARARE